MPKETEVWSLNEESSGPCALMEAEVDSTSVADLEDRFVWIDPPGGEVLLFDLGLISVSADYSYQSPIGAYDSTEDFERPLESWPAARKNNELADSVASPPVPRPVRPFEFKEPRPSTRPKRSIPTVSRKIEVMGLGLLSMGLLGLAQGMSKVVVIHPGILLSLGVMLVGMMLAGVMSHQGDHAMPAQDRDPKDKSVIGWILICALGMLSCALLGIAQLRSGTVLIHPLLLLALAAILFGFTLVGMLRSPTRP